ncbi:Ethylene-responsive transcription factor [Cardamine amara subsp. amara]|uniref:Ethylene-responsive transcription factor n=1 Tax=Cardamine amara subsp. amara TaxID=228776 RepID=A0ABD1BFM2_CARAN
MASSHQQEQNQSALDLITQHLLTDFPSLETFVSSINHCTTSTLSQRKPHLDTIYHYCTRGCSEALQRREAKTMGESMQLKLETQKVMVIVFG